jgi:16S rRNA (cytidine1402-2'-O)-methyltransferase
MLISLGDREMAAARELTKIYEQVVRGKISQVIAHFAETEPRGEFVLIIGGQAADVGTETWSEQDVMTAIQSALNEGRPSKEIAADLSQKSGWARRTIYKMAIEDK